MAGVAGGDLTKLWAEYNLAGTEHAEYANGIFKANYMLGMIMNGDNSAFAGQIIDAISATPDGSYFGDTVIFMSLLTASGLFVANPPSVAPIGGNKKVRIAGAFVTKPVKQKIGGVWLQKPVKKLVGTTWSKTIT